jgi:hypothetical protein
MARSKKVKGNRRPEDRVREEKRSPHCKTSAGLDVLVETVANPSPQASFGFLGEAVRVGPKPAFRYAFLEIPIDPEALRARELDGDALRIFHWDEKEKGFRVLPESSVDAAWGRVSSQITKPGIYAVIGLSVNPWIRTTQEVFYSLETLLRIPELRQPLQNRICGLILCPPPFLEDLMADPERMIGFGLPPAPMGGQGTLCEQCLGLGLDPFGVPPEIQIVPLLEKPIRFRPPPLDPCAVWLRDHPQVANAIVWRDELVPRPYPSWTPSEQAELCKAVWEIRLGTWAGLSATPAMTLSLFTTVNPDGTRDLFSTEIDKATAWQYFIGYVAQSIAAEQSAWLTWSVAGYSAAELELLFDSRSLFEWGSGPQKYAVLRDHNILFRHGAAMPGDPVRTFDFLRTNGFLAPTTRGTVERLLDWCRSNLAHFYGGFDPANMNAHWQYEGWPPVERIISGTTHPQYGFAHWTGGCWGTVGFLRTVLRTANIPVMLERCCDHALPHFLRDAIFLSHGDDPYNGLSKGNPPPFPIGNLLLDQATFNSWFGPTVPVSTVCTNVGRQTRELALQYLPDYLLRARCDDLAAGTAPGQSRVFDIFSLDYTLAQLQALNLWQNIDAKIALLGGCANIP